MSSNGTGITHERALEVALSCMRGVKVDPVDVCRAISAVEKLHSQIVKRRIKQQEYVADVIRRQKAGEYD